MNKALVVADFEWWALARIYRGVKKYVTDWSIDVHYAEENPIISHEGYDVILFLCDYRYELIEKNRIPREKIILAIRSNVRNRFYDSKKKLVKAAKIIAPANRRLCERFERLHPRVILAPGGVDTDINFFKPKPFGNGIRVGWAGSRNNFGESFRGLSIIKTACEKAGYIYNPAIREERLRTEDEMVNYYHNEIDIYVEMSAEGGFCRGAIEAGACGVPVISNRVGVMGDLISHGVNGLLCERSVVSLHGCLLQIPSIAEMCSINLRETIEQKWSWKVQSQVFKSMFEEIVREEQDICRG
jgi:glycosyltransferase involved in cell wall biosynthesis